MISIIVAQAENRAIGRNNQLLWHLPDDLRWFKKNTIGKPIIMGRKTYESIGKPLPDRQNIVVTRNADFQAPGCIVVASLEAALQTPKNDAEIMVIGGAEIYALALPYTKRLYLTQVQASFEADAYFPEVDWQSWREIFKEEHPVDFKNTLGHTFKILER